MKNYLVIGIRYGVYTSMILHTTKECATMRATQKGFTEIFEIEEA